MMRVAAAADDDYDVGDKIHINPSNNEKRNGLAGAGNAGEFIVISLKAGCEETRKRTHVRYFKYQKGVLM